MKKNNGFFIAGKIFVIISLVLRVCTIIGLFISLALVNYNVQSNVNHSYNYTYNEYPYFDNTVNAEITDNTNNNIFNNIEDFFANSQRIASNLILMFIVIDWVFLGFDILILVRLSRKPDITDKWAVVTIIFSSIIGGLFLLLSIHTEQDELETV